MASLDIKMKIPEAFARGFFSSSQPLNYILNYSTAPFLYRFIRHNFQMSPLFFLHLQKEIAFDAGVELVEKCSLHVVIAACRFNVPAKSAAIVSSVVCVVCRFGCGGTNSQSVNVDASRLSAATHKFPAVHYLTLHYNPCLILNKSNSLILKVNVFITTCKDRMKY